MNGWKLVPLEPTPEMIAAASATPGMQAVNGVLALYQARSGMLGDWPGEGSPIEQAYSAMLSSLPSAAARGEADSGTGGDAQPYSGWVWKHIKTGGEYSLLGHAKVQAHLDAPLTDMTEVYVYQGEDHRMWVRSVAEFNERFKRCRPVPRDAAPIGGSSLGGVEAQRDALLRQAFDALAAELDPMWQCESYHPKIWAALRALKDHFAALSPKSCPPGSQCERKARGLDGCAAGVCRKEDGDGVNVRSDVQLHITDLLVAHRDLIEAQQGGDAEAEADAARRMETARAAASGVGGTDGR